MVKRLRTEWAVTPCSPPLIYLHCSFCRTDRPFASSGRIRLNSNGKRLDAWLIYGCSLCGKTWNRPIIERLRAADLDPVFADQLRQNAPSLVRKLEFDLVALKRHSERVESPAGVCTKKEIRPYLGEEVRWVDLEIRVDLPAGIRVDRLLSSELKMSRNRLQRMFADGSISLASPHRTALKKPPGYDLSITIRLPDSVSEEREAILSSVFR
ncbi:MAG: DUF1062 domain-containing protein [Pseudomonadota bacterium]